MALLVERRNIVIAIEESEFSDFAFDFYMKTVHRETDNIILVHVTEYSKLLQSPTLFTDPAVVASLAKEVEQKVTALVAKYNQKMKDNNVRGKVKQVNGKVGEAILQAAEEENATIVVVGCRGLGKLRRALLGSVSDYLTHHCNVPVLVCRMGTQGTQN